MKKSFFMCFCSLVVLSSLTYAQVTISGTVTYEGGGLAGVVMNGLPGNPVTDSSGHYSASVYRGWGATVTPALEDYLFTPPSTVYYNVMEDRLDNYVATYEYFLYEPYDNISEPAAGVACVIPVDFNNDGFIDLIVPLIDTQWAPMPIHAFANDGAGHFTGVTAQVLGDIRAIGPYGLAADFNNDGLMDVYILDGGADADPWPGAPDILLIQQPDGTMNNEAATRLPGFCDYNECMVGGDFDNDGDIDLFIMAVGAIKDKSGADSFFLVNDGTGHFGVDYNRVPPLVGAHFWTTDINKDGSLDLVLTANDGRCGHILLNDGHGYFSYGPADALPPAWDDSISEPAGISVVDADADGWPDLIVNEVNFEYTQGHAHLVLNNHDGTFRDARDRIPQYPILGSAGAADFNNDGWPDLLGQYLYSRLFINLGEGYFQDVTEEVFIEHNYNQGWCSTADIDNDGDIDGIINMGHGFAVFRNMKPYAGGAAPIPYPAAPTPVSPPDGSLLTTMAPLLEWSAVNTASSYHLQVAADAAFSQIISDKKDVAPNSWRVGGFHGNTTYYWHVRANNTRGAGPWSGTFGFTTPQTVTISGRISLQKDGSPLAHADLGGLPGNVRTDDAGDYSAEVEPGWTGTVTPYKAGYSFLPESADYSSIGGSQVTNYESYQGLPAKQRRALIALFNATDGDAWQNLNGWKTPPLEADGFAAYGSEGTWYGVETYFNAVSRLYFATDVRLNGHLPAELGDLGNLLFLLILNDWDRGITGPVPESFANLINLQYLFIRGCSPYQLTGDLPSYLGNLTRLVQVTLYLNAFTGPLPSNIGQLTNLTGLDIFGNMLSGPIPSSFMNLTKLIPESAYTNIGYNALYTSDPELRAFLNTKDPDWEDTQTIAPTDVTAVPGSTSVTVSWTPIAYKGDTGGYRVFYATIMGGPYTFYAQTANKSASSQLVTGLTPGTPYYFVVQTRTNPHANNTNVLDSENSAEATATTLAPIIREDFVGTWDGQGVYYRNSDTAGWVKMSSPATMITTGDLDGDGIDDLIGLWPTQGGIWVKYSQTGLWARLSSTAVHIAAGDMNGDGREDLLGTWDGQGVYYRNSITSAWVKLASPATMITTGDLDGDGTDDLIGIWPSQGGVWVKNSQSGAWARLSSTARDIAAGDMNGDGRDDLVATWDGQGVYYRNSMSGAWVRMASEATQVTCGDLDADGKADLIGIWPTQGGVWVKYSQTGAWALLSSSAQDISAGAMRAAGTMSAVPAGELALPLGGFEPGPEAGRAGPDRSDNGPGGAKFAPKAQKNLLPTEGPSVRTPRHPGPGEPGFKCTQEKNLEPRREATRRKVDKVEKRVG